jgi:hypothetical protein
MTRGNIYNSLHFALPLPFGLGSPNLFGSGGGGFFGGQLNNMVVVVTLVTFQSLAPFDCEAGHAIM